MRRMQYPCYLFRESGQAIGVAVGGTVFRYKLSEILTLGDVAAEATVEDC